MEVGLGSLFRFLSSNARFFVLSALVFSAVTAVVLLLLRPESYQKQVTLAVDTTPGLLAGQLGFDDLQIKPPTPEEVGEISVAAVEAADLDGVEANAGRSDEGASDVPVTLRSRRVGAFDGAIPSLVEAVEAEFQSEYEDVFAEAIEQRVSELDLDLRIQEGLVSEMEGQAEALYAAGLQDAGATARAEALENERAVALGDIFEAKAERDNLEQAREDLPQLIRQVTDVSVSEESAPTETGSTAATIALAVPIGLALAVATTVAGVTIKAFWVGGKRRTSIR